MVYKDALEDLVQVKRLTRRVTVIPAQLARVRIERNRAAAIERRAIAGSAAGPHPGLGLGYTPVSEIEIGVVRAGNPGFAPRAVEIVQSIPGIAARGPGEGDGGEAPVLRAGIGVESRDRALFAAISAATGEAGQHLAVDDHHSASLVMALACDGHIPGDLATACVQRNQ